MKAKKHAMRPGYGGQREEREEIIDNPLANLRVDLGSERVKTTKQVVTRNVRETPVDHWFARGEIDARLKTAANWFREQIEAARIGGGVVDPAKVRVDTSGAKSGAPVRAIDASRALAGVQKKIGMMDFDLLVQACSVGLTISDVTSRWYSAPEGSNLERECRLHVARRIKDALNIVAVHVGLALDMGRKPSNRRGNFHRAFSRAEVDQEQWEK